jgi:hypothetical protein
LAGDIDINFIPVAGFFADRVSREESSSARLAERIGGACIDLNGEIGRVEAWKSSEGWIGLVDLTGLPRNILIGEGGAIETGWGSFDSKFGSTGTSTVPTTVLTGLAIAFFVVFDPVFGPVALVLRTDLVLTVDCMGTGALTATFFEVAFGAAFEAVFRAGFGAAFGAAFAAIFAAGFGAASGMLFVSVALVLRVDLDEIVGGVAEVAALAAAFFSATLVAAV